MFEWVKEHIPVTCEACLDSVENPMNRGQVVWWDLLEKDKATLEAVEEGEEGDNDSNDNSEGMEETES